MSSNEITALITLMDDPDEAVYTQVRQELVSYGERIIPWLERFWETNKYGDLFHARVEQLIQSIHLDAVKEKLGLWKKSGAENLMEGLLILNRFEHLSLDEGELRQNISRIRQDIWLELNDNLTALETIQVFNHILFRVHRFEGIEDDLFSVRHTHLSDLLATHKATPMGMSVLYLMLAEALEIPVYGVNLPNQFVLCYKDEDSLLSHFEGEQSDGVLFYINPFGGGNVMHRDEIDQFFEDSEVPEHARSYGPCSNIDVLNRVLDALILGYSQKGRVQKVDDLQQIQALLIARQD